MGWSINEVENTVRIPVEFAGKIFDAGQGEHFFGDREDAEGEVLEDIENGTGLLRFEPDSMEHMDYLWDQDILNVLAEAKVNGRVVFTSTEGDNRNTWWSYTFIDGAVEEDGGKLSDLLPA